MLAAFDASLSHSGINSSRIAVEDHSRIKHATGTNLTGSGPEERQNSTDLLPECCHIGSCKARSYCDNGHSASESESCRHQSVSSVIRSHTEALTDSLDHANHEKHVTFPEVKSVDISNLAGKGQLTTEVDSAEALPRSVAVVQRRSAGRLSEKIKRTLQQNAKLDTPTRLNRLPAVIEKYDVRHDADVTDTDPFCGLPHKVRQLLETQRSITELYRMFLSLLFLFGGRSLPP